MNKIILTLCTLVLPLLSFVASDISVIEPYLLNVTSTSIQVHWEVEAGLSLVKYGKDKQSEYQKQYQKDIERAGGVYLIARNMDEFIEWYIDFIKNK